MKKIVVVAFHLGRVGSSAMIGLLNLAGINVGKKEHLIGPQPMNPKGFFELTTQRKFMEKVFPGIYPDVTNPPTLETLDKIGKGFSYEYDRLLQEEFQNHFQIAVKSQRFLTIPFLNYLKNKYDIRVVVMERNLRNQVNSIRKVWKKFGDSCQKNASKKFITNYSKKWQSFGRSVENHYDLPFFHVFFEDLMANPWCVSRAIFGFIRERCPTQKQIFTWLDNSLVNRPL